MANRRDWEDLFRRADADMSGHVTVTELAKTMSLLGYPGSETKMKLLIAESDRDFNKMLSMEEFVACMKKAPMEVHVAALLNTVFTKYDMNRDGEISLEELQETFIRRGKKVTPAQIRSILAAADLDGSGTINLKEFQLALARRLV